MAKETGKEIEERRSDSFLRDILDNLDQYAFGIITQHGYRELEAKLDRHAEDIETRFHRWFVRGLVAFGLMALGVVLGLVLYGVVLGNQGDLLKQFKDTRKAFVLDSCKAQNKRHDKTLQRLAVAEKKEEKRHTTRKSIMRVRNQAEVSIGLIDAIVPVQNCKRLAEVSVGDAKPPPPDIPTK